MISLFKSVDISVIDCLTSPRSLLDYQRERFTKTKMNEIVMQVLYGSETGTAQDVAEQIWKSAKRKGLQSTVSSLDDYNIQNFSSEQLIIFVVATTGQGDPPANMRQFWRHLLRKNLPTTLLQNLKYGVLGLGDSSYSKFNFAAKKLNKRLAQLGGKELLSIGLADDQHNLGIDAVVDPWIKKLWEEIADVFEISLEDKINEKNLIIERYSVSIIELNRLNPIHINEQLIDSPYESNTDIYAQETLINSNIRIGKIVENIRTTSKDHFQDVRLIAIQVDNIKYNPGDVIYIRPKNTVGQVKRFFDILHEHDIKLFPDTMIQVSKKEIKVPFVLKRNLTLKEIVEQYWDLNFKPRRSTMHTLSLISENELEKEKLCEFASPIGQEELYDYVNRPRRNILEVLTDFPHTTSKLNIKLLFEIMSPIKPRPYSIASSLEDTPNKIQILVAVVKFKTRLMEPRFGLCSKWVANLKNNDKVIFWLQKGTFQFDNDKPMILIGPGTGVAPFRSLLLERAKKGEDLKECILFFGCRNKNQDYHCKEDFERLSRTNNLRLFCAFSRDQDHKIYVQHLIRQQRQLCWEFLENNGNIYLAGTEPVRLSPGWEGTGRPDDELNFKGVTMDQADLELNPPRDRLNLVFFILILHGIGALMPWNMFITAKDYFVNYKLSKEYTDIDSNYATNFLAYLGFASQVPNLLFNWLNIFLQFGGNLTTRIVWSIFVLVLIFVFTVILAMTDSSGWPGIFFWITMVSVVILNTANGIYQNSVFGMAAKLPIKYTGAVILGSNISGTFTAIINFLAQIMAPNARTAAIYYFITALFILLACFDTYFALPINRFYRYHELLHQKETNKRQLENNSRGKHKPPYWTVFKACFPQCFNTFLIFFVTLALFPTVQSDIKSLDENFVVPPEYYSSVMCFLTFNITAMLGSSIASLVQWPSRKYLIIPVVLRLAYIPLFLLCNYQPIKTERILPVLIKNDWVFWTIAITMGLSSGYLSSLSMMYCPRMVDSQYASTAGMFGAASLITGLFTGILFSMVMPFIVANVTF
ncbi:NADPH-dependent diflavin oxidoreductase 1-like [Monomorium pharaonis]|uniref:NADPH-dependent diflavin oxidoreductase 1-like n=1 Tax=Monomorium pharaonis TaxID=307658 RepID=UPI0017466ED7|nr:NADPH-dependent diflavin oxidoreductase 1-like [Monomorium pharaonis]